MSTVETHDLTRTDIDYLQGLAKQLAEAAASDVNQQRIANWKRHNDLGDGRPMVLISPEGGWAEIIAIMDQHYEREHPCHRLEWWFLSQLHTWYNFRCDNVLWSYLPVPTRIRRSGWGLEPRWHHSTTERGARAFAPVLTDQDDLAKLIPQTILEIDYQATHQHQSFHEEIFGEHFPSRIEKVKHISYHLMQWYSALRGLEEMMIDMYEEPELLHQACRLYTDAQHAMLDRLESEDLIENNSDNTYHSSGGNGWSEQFPPTGVTGLKAMWGSAEVQELAQVGPAQHREFALAYEAELLNRFGRTGYGCCEDLTNKLDDLFELVPNMHRVSISPWADVQRCAEQLGGRRAIFSWKPQPAHLVGQFNETTIRDYIANTVRICKQHDCQLEIILKDTHSCEQKPERFDRWSELCQEAIDSVWG